MQKQSNSVKLLINKRLNYVKRRLHPESNYPPIEHKEDDALSATPHNRNEAFLIRLLEDGLIQAFSDIKEILCAGESYIAKAGEFRKPDIMSSRLLNMKAELIKKLSTTAPEDGDRGELSSNPKCEENGLSRLVQLLERAEKSLRDEKFLDCYISYNKVASLCANELNNEALASNFYKRCYALANIVGDEHLVAESMLNIGSAFNSMGYSLKEKEIYIVAAEISKKTGSEVLRVKALEKLLWWHKQEAERLVKDENSEKALSEYEAYLGLALESGDPLRAANAYFEIGEFYNQHGKVKDAIASLERAQEYVGKSDVKPLILQKMLLQMGKLNVRIGDYKAATEKLEQQLSSDYVQAPNVEMQCGAHFLLGLIHETIGDNNASKENIEKSYEIAKKHNKQSMVDSARPILGKIRAGELLDHYKAMVTSDSLKVLQWKVARVFE